MKTENIQNLFDAEVKETIKSKKEMILSLYNSGTTEVEAEYLEVTAKRA